MHIIFTNLQQIHIVFYEAKIMKNDKTVLQFKKYTIVFLHKAIVKKKTMRNVSTCCVQKLFQIVLFVTNKDKNVRKYKDSFTEQASK